MKATKINKTTTVLDTEQLGFHYDVIKCPTCGHCQQAKVIHNSEGFISIHKCTTCAYMIEADDWDSQITI